MFRTEFCAMKQVTEYVRVFRYKLRMMGIPVEEPSFIFGDNQSVLANTTRPESQLKKKTQSIVYHHVHRGCVKDKWHIAYVNTHENVAYLLMKPLSKG